MDYGSVYKMPIDIFGRTDGSRVVSDGVTLSQVNNLFLRRDCGNTATSDINLDNHKLINVTDPTNDQDVVTKKYLTDRVPLPLSKLLAPYATDLNSYEWKYFQAIPEGLSEGDFDNLPSGLYACYTGYIPPNRLGNLPRNTKGYLIAMTYQQPVDRNKYYKWISSTNGDEWCAYFRQNTWNTWVNNSSKKCNVGYVPRLTSNTNYRGFATHASSESRPRYIAANAFNGDYVSGDGAGGEWTTANVSSNFWIKLACPTAVRTWKFGFRGRDTDSGRIYNWRIEGSTDNTNWVTLYTAPNPTYLSSSYQEFTVDSVRKYQYFRLFCVQAEPSSPGLSTMQLFVYDD